jgi:broad specificity phosphatase PhoE
LYIIRHCEADGNVKEVFQGRTDGDITEKGACQLEQLRERCRDIPFDVIYTSPLIRAKKTAEAVNAVHNVPLIEDAELMEIDGGDMEGVKWADLPALFPDTYKLWVKDIANFQAPNGESTRGLYERVKSAILRIISANEGKTVGVFSHGGAMYGMLAFAHGLSADELTENPFWCENTGISRVDFTGNEPAPVFVNDFKHIGGIAETAPRMMNWRKNK